MSARLSSPRSPALVACSSLRSQSLSHRRQTFRNVLDSLLDTQLTRLSASSPPAPFKSVRQVGPETEAFDEEIERIFEMYKGK